ncbi:MAG: hypothetical protein A2X94_07315 [Bdellovibrionales bacterium GWB1_55_8]|nr:MAG: hypothetical protein A2X94_07315 [Bdellovibrionales bacterium GWB1_55_8]
MIHVFLVYGLAFILLGSVALFQAGTTVRILPLRAMIFLSLFGFLHGAAEWVEIAKVFHGPPLGPIFTLSLCLITLSYVSLVALGFELLVEYAHFPAWSRFGSVVLFGLCWGFGVIFTAPYDWGHPLAFTIREIGARYHLGLPGAALTCAGFLALARNKTGRLERGLRRRFIWAGAGFGLYALAAGIMVPAAPIPIASVLNAGSFEELFGFRIVLLRTFAAFLIAGALMQAFIVEISRINSLWGRMREEFISLVAHDLKSSLSGVSLASELMIEELPQADTSPERIQRIAKQIHNTSMGLSRIVGDLLDASLIASNRLTVRTEQLDLVQLVSSAAERAQTHFRDRELNWIPPKTELLAAVDPVRVDQVLANLLSNAQKYAPVGTPISLLLSQHGPHGVLQVTNHIDEKLDTSELHLLFERYYRSQEAKMGRFQGTGLGLFIVKGIVEAHGGQAWAKTLGNGQVGFFVSFPLNPSI